MSLNVVSVVDKLSSLSLIRLHKVSGDWYQCYCPIHNEGNERRPSFGILLHDQYRNGQHYPAGFGHCFACGYAKPIDQLIGDILESKSISKSGLDWLKENIPEFEGQADFDYLIPQDTMKTIESNFAVEYIQSLQPKQVEYVSEEELAKYRFTVPYMYERKLTDEIIEKFDVGYDPDWVPEGRKRPIPCITFPVKDVNGHTLFICRRSIQGKIYNYPEGSIKPVYGIDQVPKGTKSIIICESIINALTCWTYGYPALALLGTGNFSQAQQIKELGFSDIVLCLDGDSAGRKGAKRMKKYLSDAMIVWVVTVPDGKDVNDLTKDEFEELYKERE